MLKTQCLRGTCLRTSVRIAAVQISINHVRYIRSPEPVSGRVQVVPNAFQFLEMIFHAFVERAVLWVSRLVDPARRFNPGNKKASSYLGTPAGLYGLLHGIVRRRQIDHRPDSLRPAPGNGRAAGHAPGRRHRSAQSVQRTGIYEGTPEHQGLYAKARAGLIQGFTGINDPYEPPPGPEVFIDTTDMTPDESAQEVLLYLERAGYIK